MKLTTALNKRAWEVRREAGKKFGVKVSEISWGFCLLIATNEANQAKEEQVDGFNDTFSGYSFKDFYTVSAVEVEKYLKLLIENKKKTSAFFHICKHFYQGGKWKNHFLINPYAKYSKSYFSDYYAQIKGF